MFLDISYSSLNSTIVAASADRHVRLYDPRVTGKEGEGERGGWGEGGIPGLMLIGLLLL